MRIYVDGGSLGNPGPITVAIVCEELNKKHVQRLGEGTNNDAEYLAIIEGLKKAKEWGLKEFELASDSQLVLKQIAGKYAITVERFRDYVQMIRDLLMNFRKVKFIWVRRDLNPAHQLVADNLPDVEVVMEYEGEKV